MDLIKIMRERRAATKTQLDELLAFPAAESRDLTEEEDTRFTELSTEIRRQDERIAELEEQEKRAAAAGTAAVAAGQTGTQEPNGTSGTKVTDPPVYVRGGKNGQSYFRDLAKSQLEGSRDSAERLRRHAAAAADEQRALGNTNTTGGSGGEFAPPSWLVEDFVALVRPGRATAQLYSSMPVPRGVSSVNLPKVLSGTSVALQSTQNTALSSTDLTTGSVGTGFSTIGGTQVVSQQLLDQSEIPFDRVVTQDLAAAWSLEFGNRIVSGAGTGTNNNSVVNGLINASVLPNNATTWTQANPTAAGFYGQCAKMLSSFSTTRFAPPTVWLMHPRRWFWLLGQSDANQRPLVVPDVMLAKQSIMAFNPVAANTGNPVDVVGAVGMFLGLPVVIDPLLPTNLGSGTNQDEVFLLKSDDLWLLESDPVAEVFREPFAGSMGVLFRLYSYVGAILNRQTASIATLNGTGLSTPAFPS